MPDHKTTLLHQFVRNRIIDQNAKAEYISSHQSAAMGGATIVTPYYDLSLQAPIDCEEGTTSNLLDDSLNDPIKDEHQLGSDTMKQLSYWDAVMILTTFNTSGSVILMPWAYGQLGYIIGPLSHIALMGIVLFFNLFLIDVALLDSTGSSRQCRSLGDVGYRLASTFGRGLFLFLQLANLVLYLPVALETIALSIQYLSGYALGNCVGWWNLICFGILLLLLQFVKHWHHAAWIAYATVALAALKAFGLLPYAFVTYRDEVQASDTYLGPALAAGNPENNWHDLALAVSVFSYTFCPSFILVEVMRDVEDKTTYKPALCAATAIQSCFYLIPGLVCISLWGWNVTQPITLEIPDSWVGLLMSALVAIAVCLDYIIASKIVNDWVKIAFFQTYNANGALCHFGVTLLSGAISLGLVLGIPNLSTLVGIVTGVTIIGMNSWAITLAWVWGGKVVERTKRSVFVLYLAGLVCVPYTAWVTAAAVYEIVTADYSSTSFFCGGE